MASGSDATGGMGLAPTTPHVEEETAPCATAEKTFEKQPPPPAAPTTSSARSMALHYRCGHTQVQAVRDALACRFMEIQKQKLEEMPVAQYGFLQIALDETEMKVNIEFNGTVAHTMTAHLRMSVCWRP